MTTIEMRGLTKRYGDITAVDDLELSVRDGEIFGFLGPNGAGKSTTIDMLLDFTRPTGGVVKVFGEEPRQNPREFRERIGVLPDTYGLYDRLSARQHIVFAAQMKRCDNDPEVLLERVGLLDDATMRVGGFSKGMRQRLALAIALVGSPDLLILDEPSSGLDPNGAQMMRDIICTEREQGVTTFFSSHILGQVEAVCDRVGIMRDGNLLTVDTVDGLQAASGSVSTLVFLVDRIPQCHSLAKLDGVTDVHCKDSTIRVECSDPNMKAAIIASVEAADVAVQDISIEDSTLEDIFAKYTKNCDRSEEYKREIRA
ncbi:ABC transporter ATP-binding protein [Halococcus sp. IIIV-5B]|uniref:ABC transporter ATP-binding protein n=1 Tax=Halococcus sp. IIIV-5B TaxID=2321230 RepID=UPI000E727A7F|nr:ABC transporter ATP-binding protein [Halococcus sp. IIIV-5B]RJT07530.1 ABC transporter ATP-binding protein [Halococcus sp. IIIV-5B]